MRKGSVIGPLVLIAIGALFLMRSLMPQIPFWDILATWWPFLLIGWGALRLVEISVQAAGGRPLPQSGVSGGEWVLVIFICIIGSTMWAAHRHSWWNGGPWRGIVSDMGENYDYGLTPATATAGKTPHIMIEAFRGNARIVGTDDETVKVDGRKSVRSLSQKEADDADRQTPLQVIADKEGTIVVRTNQDKANGRLRVSEDLEISVPKGATIEGHGLYGDFDVTGVNGSVDITSDNAGVRLQDIGGDVRVQVDKSDVVRAVGVKGKVDMRASRGEDIELDNIQGMVTASGTWSGEVELRNLAQTVKFDGSNFSFEAVKVPGQVRLSGSDLTGNSVVGPIRLSAQARDIQLTDFTQSLDLDVDRGDIELRPAKTGVPKMEVRVRSGDVDLALPPQSKFDLKASTDRGELRNEYGAPLQVHEADNGNAGTIAGAVGNGPQVRITTDRGTVTVRKAGTEASAKTDDSEGKPVEN
ncbi:MAG TPA: DUF4097 family beta strand repeat-containing protein [Bryobacteraceae bacterium]|nr:DUF4097 family beta strand repeat-containing protein [Bryobacteraceae bacterium]